VIGLALDVFHWRIFFADPDSCRGSRRFNR
jgi:hypothetical protein